MFVFDLTYKAPKIFLSCQYLFLKLLLYTAKNKS